MDNLFAVDDFGARADIAEGSTFPHFLGAVFNSTSTTVLHHGVLGVLFRVTVTCFRRALQEPLAARRSRNEPWITKQLPIPSAASKRHPNADLYRSCLHRYPYRSEVPDRFHTRIAGYVRSSSAKPRTFFTVDHFRANSSLGPGSKGIGRGSRSNFYLITLLACQGRAPRGNAYYGLTLRVFSGSADMTGKVDDTKQIYLPLKPPQH